MSITCGQRIVSGTGISGPSGTPKHAWLYDENHGRIKETRTIASGTYAGTRVTWALHADKMGGLDFESEVNSPTNPSAANPAVTSNRHYLSAGGQVIGVLVTTGALPTLAANDTAPPLLTSTNAVKLEYWHKDHLGSTAATTDHTGALTARYAYDPFGKRRDTNGSYDAAGAIVVDWSPAVNNGNDRGYTGHEHLDDVGLVHMNGRVFDPRLGVFLQADPMTQDPYNLQGFNRYGYCLNNPLTCTDPSGLSFWTQHRAMIIGLAVAIVAPQAIGWILTQGALGSAFVTLSYGVFDGAVTGLSALGNFTVAAVSGFASGAVASGNLEGGLQGAFTAGMFYGAGDLISGTGAFAGTGGVNNDLGRIAIHGVVGCVTSEVGGGKCGPGAAAAAFSKFATVSGAVGRDIVSGTITSAVVGGTAAELGGGKFANGAMTAAFGYLYNYCLHATTECALDWLHNAGKVAMGGLGVNAAIAACGGSAGIACGPAVALASWGVNEAIEGASWLRAEDAEGINPAKQSLMLLSSTLTGSATYGELAYNGASLGMNLWSARTATQIWLTTPRLGGGWLTTGYAWQSMNSIDRSWLLFDSARTVQDAVPDKKR